MAYSLALLVALIVGYGLVRTSFSDRIWYDFISVDGNSQPPTTSSSWFNLYKSLVLTYLTIRFYHLFCGTDFATVGDQHVGLTGLLSAFPSMGQDENTQATTAMAMGSRRSSLTAKDYAVFAKVKEVKEVKQSALAEEDSQEEEEEEVEADDSAAEKEELREEMLQTIDMSGLYQLLENENFGEFLEAGHSLDVREGCQPGSTNSSYHSRWATHYHQIEGLMESSSTYTINGPPLKGFIHGRLFPDKITLIT